MSNLTIFKDDNPNHVILNTDDNSDIIEQLRAIGVNFEQWQTQKPLPKGADDVMVMDAYESDIARIKENGGYNSVDVVRLTSNHPNKCDLRNKFLNEHIHTEDEVRFFVEGSGMFYIHAGDNVYMIKCCAGDLINVPANAKHWFDMGKNPNFTCIRLFTSKDGWVADYTDDDIADKFPKFDK